MPQRGQPLWITYTAWNTATNQPEPGDDANHTLRWEFNGAAAAPVNAPSTEIDATNFPGEYRLLLTDLETQTGFGALGGTSSTANIIIIPRHILFQGSLRGSF